MDSVRVSAKTVQDALMEAAIELGTSSDNIEYTVVDEGSKGFFGIGGRKATIEAKKKVTDEDLMKEIFEEKPSRPRKEAKKEYKKEYKQDKQDNKQEKKEGKKEPKKSSMKDSSSKENKVKESSKESSVRKPSVKESSAKESSVKEASAKEASAKEASAKEASAKEASVKNDSAQKSYQKKTVEKAAAVRESADESAPREPREPADPEEAKKRASVFLTDILKAMGMDVEIRTEFEDGVLSVDIEGDDMGIMIGKRGQTLDSLQYLTSLVVNKGKASYVRVKLDTEDYRNRRKATLENLAKNIAIKVKKTRHPVFLEPMNPYERRIIHSALQNDPYVTTHSEGDEPYRRVVVTLKKDRDYDRKGDGYSRYNNYNRRNRYSRDSRPENHQKGDSVKDSGKEAVQSEFQNEEE